MNLYFLKKDIDYRYNVFYFSAKKRIKKKNMWVAEAITSKKDILYAKLVLSVKLMENFHEESIILKPASSVSKVIYFLIEETPLISSSFLKEIFKTEHVKVSNRYIGILVNGVMANGIKFRNEEEKAFLSFFYKSDGIGICLSRFFANTDFYLCDKGIVYPKEKKLLVLSPQELLSILNLPYPPPETSISDIAKYISQSPYYSKLYFETLPFYKMNTKEKKIAFLNVKLRNYIKKNIHTPSSIASLNSTLLSIFNSLPVLGTLPPS